MTCTYQGVCPMIPAAFQGTSIAAGKCERCQHNSNSKGGAKRGRR